MGLAIQANQGDWGGAQLSDIEAVARSTADSFAAFDDDEAIAITLEPTSSKDDPPRTQSGTGPGRSVVRLNVRGEPRPGSPISSVTSTAMCSPTQRPGPRDRDALSGSRKRCAKLPRSSLSAAWRKSGPSSHPIQAGESIPSRSQRTKPNMSPIRCVPCLPEPSSPTGWVTTCICLKGIRTAETTTPSSPGNSCASSRPTVPPGERCAACIPRHSRLKLHLPDSCVIGQRRARRRIAELSDRSLCSSSLAGIAGEA
jgi:hypothetical protein